MKKILAVMVAGCVACLGARGESPARVVGTVATAGTSFAVPASGGVAFRLEAVVFGAAAGTTQTVALVQGTITNQVVSATDRMLVLTNAPWLFQGEFVRITTTAASAFPLVCTGVTEDCGSAYVILTLFRHEPEIGFRMLLAVQFISRQLFPNVTIDKAPC